MDLATISTIIITISVFFYFNYKIRSSRQLAYIKSYQFHSSIKNKLLTKHPDLSQDQLHLVFRVLRDYFWMCNKGK